jgi:hypothetical protein
VTWEERGEKPHHGGRPGGRRCYANPKMRDERAPETTAAGYRREVKVRV